MTSLLTVDEEVETASLNENVALATSSRVSDDTNLKRTLSKLGTFETEEEEHKNRRTLAARRIKSFKKSERVALVQNQSEDLDDVLLMKTLTDEIEGFEDVSYEHVFSSSSDDEEVFTEDGESNFYYLSKMLI